jgi:hypothetical protein
MESELRKHSLAGHPPLIGGHGAVLVQVTCPQVWYQFLC